MPPQNGSGPPRPPVQPLYAIHEGSHSADGSGGVPQLSQARQDEMGLKQAGSYHHQQPQSVQMGGGPDAWAQAGITQPTMVQGLDPVSPTRSSISYCQRKRSLTIVFLVQNFSFGQQQPSPHHANHSASSYSTANPSTAHHTPQTRPPSSGPHPPQEHANLGGGGPVHLNPDDRYAAPNLTFDLEGPGYEDEVTAKLAQQGGGGYGFGFR